MTSKTDQINELLTRGVEDVIPSRDAFVKALSGGKRLTIYHGVDPTGPHLHLGHSTNYLFLRRFQQLGHRVILLIGDFTARIGDPSGRTNGRVPLSKKEVLNNLKTYKKQAAKLLDFESKENPVELAHNSAWLQKLTLEDIVDAAAHFTVQQMLARDMFQARIKNKNPIGLHEFLYPLMQGYDSVALKADAEVGGKDQLFNMLVGRDLVKASLGKEKFVITTKLLVNPKTGRKLMSKSEGSYVALDDSPANMYGGIMALPDEVIFGCFKLCTEVRLARIEKIRELSARDAKAYLAREIVSMYHDPKDADKAEKEFNKTFVFRQSPPGTPTTVMMGGVTSTTKVLIETGLSLTKSEARRLEEQRGVHVQMRGSKHWETAGETINVQDGMTIRVGKRGFRGIRTKPQ